METIKMDVNGKEEEVCIISNFTIEGNEYALYGIPNKNNTYNIMCGKVIDDEVVDIEDKSDKELVESIVKTILYSINKEEFLKLDTNGFDLNGREASIIGQYEVNKNKYIVYSVVDDENKAGIYIKKMVKDGLESITDTEERNMVFAAMRDFISKEVGVA